MVQDVNGHTATFQKDLSSKAMLNLNTQIITELSLRILTWTSVPYSYRTLPSSIFFRQPVRGHLSSDKGLATLPCSAFPTPCGYFTEFFQLAPLFSRAFVLALHQQAQICSQVIKSRESLNVWGGKRALKAI